MAEYEEGALALFQEDIMASKLFAVFIIVGSLAISACNTVRGVSQDLESAADAADEAI